MSAIDDTYTDGEVMPCGCPSDYHMADCPIRTEPSTVYYHTGHDVEEDDYYHDHPPEGME